MRQCYSVALFIRNIYNDSITCPLLLKALCISSTRKNQTLQYLLYFTCCASATNKTCNNINKVCSCFININYLVNLVTK
jgi:hypothetical protein